MALSIIRSNKVRGSLTKKQATIIAIANLVAGVLIFFIAYVGVDQKIGLGKLNQPVLSWMLGHRNTEITAVTKLVTATANLQVLGVIVGIILIVWVVVKREVWRPIVLAAAVTLASTMSILLKNITMHARPPKIDMIPTALNDYSFPSGHTITMAVFILVIGYLIYSRHFSVLRLFIWIFIAMTATGLIALSRLYLGYHWLTDVVGSVGLGLVILAMVVFIDTLVARCYKN